MKRLQGWPALVSGAIAVLGVAYLGWMLLHRPSTEAEPPAPSALVSVASVQSGPVSRTVEAYGQIAGSSSATHTISAARDIVVQDVVVAPGQPVAAGSPLVVVGDTPASSLAFRQANDALAYARRELARVQRLYDQQMAANDQLGAAQKTVADAEAAVAAQSAAGAGHARQTIVSPIAGVIWQIAASRGQQVAAGAPLATVVASGGLVAQFGVEPSRATQLTVGQPVRISPALGPPTAVESRLTVVGRAVDPVTHLITVTAPAGSANLALGAAVRGEIIVAAFQGLTVPSASVVYDENGAHVFVISGGKARQVAVTTGPEQQDQIAVSGQIHAGDLVATAGAYQLQDGLAVRIGAQ